VHSFSAFLRGSFGAALAGGAIVAVFGWIAISAGWVQAQSDDQTTVAAPATIPAAAEGETPATAVGRIYDASEAGVAYIEAESAGDPGFFGTPGSGVATGSGFVIDGEGRVLTNHHVVAGADEITVKLGDSDTTYDAEMIGSDPATDLALLEVDAPESDLHPLPLGRSSEVEVGDSVIAIGNPFGLDRTVTAGIVSALQRQIQAPNGFSISEVIQTDAAINPGNSGGPLIDSSGRVIGINSQIEAGGGRGNVGIGFAVPIDTAREVVSQLESDGEVKHAYVGISGASIDAAIAGALNLPVDSGVLVQEVVPGGPADEAGLLGGDTSATIQGADIRLGGDIVTAIDGKPIASMDEFVAAVNEAEPGAVLGLNVLRDGDERSIDVTLGERPASVADANASPLGPSDR
jgi:S1-C subfamily serine protease